MHSPWVDVELGGKGRFASQAIEAATFRQWTRRMRFGPVRPFELRIARRLTSIALKAESPHTAPAGDSSARPMGSCWVMTRLLNMKSRGRLMQSAAISSALRR